GGGILAWVGSTYGNEGVLPPEPGRRRGFREGGGRRSAPGRVTLGWRRGGAHADRHRDRPGGVMAGPRDRPGHRQAAGPLALRGDPAAARPAPPAAPARGRPLPAARGAGSTVAAPRLPGAADRPHSRLPARHPVRPRL